MLRSRRSDPMITTTVRHASEAHRNQTAALRDDAIMRNHAVVVSLDLIRPDGIRDAGELIELAGVVPELGVIDDTLPIAFVKRARSPQTALQM